MKSCEVINKYLSKFEFKKSSKLIINKVVLCQDQSEPQVGGSSMGVSRLYISLFSIAFHKAIALLTIAIAIVVTLFLS